MLAPGTHVVCESTGLYHRALVAAAHAAGVALTVANPQQVRCFAKGLGRRAKTDPIDAQTLADFGRVTLPKADPAPRAAQTALLELVVARQQAVLERSTVTLQAAGQQLALVKALTRARLKMLGAQIAKLEAAIAKNPRRGGGARRPGRPARRGPGRGRADRGHRPGPLPGAGHALARPGRRAFGRGPF